MLSSALSTRLAALSETIRSQRSELLDLLRKSAILHRSPTQPVLSRDGTSARWMLDSLAVTLSPEGARLAGSCVVELLKGFDGRQIATYGLTGVPILQSCLLQTPGYRGLLVRKERKQHGSLKLIEGIIDPNEPVILIDDSVSSGMSMTEAIDRLEEAGLRVEGGICLVRFGWYGGCALLQERGYHIEAVYDIWEDFIYQMEDEEKPLANPSKYFPEIVWSDVSAPENLHPASLARLVISEYLSSGTVPRPPRRLDASYDASGGVWVSMRSRSDIYQRHARNGFWHFPGETRSGLTEDLILASLRTAADLPAGPEGLELVSKSAFAITFFSELEQCTPGQLDNDRYGIVVRSLERKDWMGGALPRMPGISNEWEQFRHARIKNARLVSFEPYELFRHEVVKAIEPGVTWQPTGAPATETAPWHGNPEVCGTITKRARDLLRAHLFAVPEMTTPLGNDLLPAGVDSVYLTIYIDGQLRGCMGQVVRNLDNDLKTLVVAALSDQRFRSHQPSGEHSVAVTVSILFNPLELGAASTAEVGQYYRHGDQALMAYHGKQVGLLLPFVAATDNLDSVQFAEAVAEKAGLDQTSCNWCRFDCVTWLADHGSCQPTTGGFKLAPKPIDDLESLLSRYASLHSNYLLKHMREDGALYSTYLPFQNRLYAGSDLSRQAHGAWVLARAKSVVGGSELNLAAERSIDFVLHRIAHNGGRIWLDDGESGASVSEVAFLLLALSNLPETDARQSLITELTATLWDSIGVHGRMVLLRHPDDADEVYQDYFPGQVLLALATAHEHSGSELNRGKLEQSFKYYRHRFRYHRHFGQVSWLMQAIGKWWAVNNDSRFAIFVFEIADWLLGYQQEKTGAFINDHQPDTPGYTTAVYLEGIAAALEVAVLMNDEARVKTYSRSFDDGFRFLDRLIIQERDRSTLPNPDWAIGGLRASIYRSEIRTDFVQHSLSAILEWKINMAMRRASGR
jgi:orotate phosphoribosyltransferase/AMMECR1 domain-containing protein